MAKLGNNSIMASIRHRAEQSLAFASLVAIFVFFTFANEAFATWSNITGILLSTAVIGLLAIGTTFVIITGGIDLSIGTGVTLTSVMIGWALANMGRGVLFRNPLFRFDKAIRAQSVIRAAIRYPGKARNP
jgi:ribose transport system permease protein